VRIGIVGGGIVGCSAAWRLARHGADVIVFEQRRVAGGATHASAGALVPYVEAHEPGPLQDLTVRSLNLYDQFIAELREESRASVEYARCGSLEVAFSKSEEDVLRATARRFAAADVRWISAAELLGIEPALAPTIRGGLVVASHGYVSAPQLTNALAQAATAKGAIFRTAHVIRVDSMEHAAVIVTEAGAVERFDRVIIASGAWGGLLEIEGHAPLPIRPVKGQLLRLRGPHLSHLLWSRTCYIVPQQNGDVLVGATMEDADFDERPTAGGVAQLLTAAVGLVPSIADGEFLEVRVGLRPATDDNLPLVGYARGSDSIVLALGHFRNGVVLAPLTARILTDLILDRINDPALKILTPARFGL
jgi:glycine oxidase